MTTLRGGMPFALSCLLTVLLSQIAFSQSEVLPTGRRRDERIAQRQNGPRRAPKEFPGQDQARPIRTEPVLADGVGPNSPAPQIPLPEPTNEPAEPEHKHDPLLLLAERAISKTSQRYLDAEENWPWQIMHGLLALRRDFELTRGDETVNCIEFISNDPTFRGKHWWQATRHGAQAHPYSGVPYEFEGHVNQFLALLSMSNLPLTHQFKVAGGRIVTMADMVRNAKMTVDDQEEITWTLWFLTHYLDIDAEWTNENGEPWSIEELVRLQTNATVTNAPCGGTHGLYALAYARNTFLHKHGRLQGVYYQADQKIRQHIELARSLQNYDGSFSSEFFKGPGHSRDFNERLKASGHMLEWLMMALPQRRLNEAWVRRAVASISTDLIHNASQPAKCGPLYHALNSLIMYRDRVKQQITPTEEQTQPNLASTAKPSEPSEQPAGPAEPGTEFVPPVKVTPTPKAVRTEPSAELSNEVLPPALPDPPSRDVTPTPKVVRTEPTAEVLPPALPDPPSLALPDSPSLALPDPPKVSLITEPRPKRTNLLARKAGSRLAEIANQASQKPEPPSALDLPDPPAPDVPAPSAPKRRIAIEPRDQSVR